MQERGGKRNERKKGKSKKGNKGNGNKWLENMIIIMNHNRVFVEL